MAVQIGINLIILVFAIMGITNMNWNQFAKVDLLFYIILKYAQQFA